MLSVVERQNSHGSSIASERISAVVPADRTAERLSHVDLDDADKHEGRIRLAIETLKGKLAAYMASCPADPNDRTEAQKEQLNRLVVGLKQIKAHQAKLKEDMITARKERRKLQAEHKEQAMVISLPKAAPPVRMEELRAMNMTKLDESDLIARYELAQKPKPIVPSGGFTNFRVAPDLKRMDFSHSDPNHPDLVEAWRPEVQNKRSAKR